MTARVEVHSFAGDEAPARRLAERLGVSYAVCGLHRFPDGETLPRVTDHRAKTVLFYGSLDQPNEKLIPLLLAADAERRLGVERLVLVAPYLCYLRQDKVFHAGEALSRDVIGNLLGRAFNRIVTVQAHIHRTRDLSTVFETPVDDVAVGANLAALFDDDAPHLVVGPDRESSPSVLAAAAELRADAAVFRKVRGGDRRVSLHFPAGVPVAARAILIVDDVCSSGATLIDAIAQLRRRGAAAIDVAIAHALFDDQAMERLKAAGVRRIVSSDSVPHPSNGLELAGVLADTLRSEVEP